MNPQAKSGHCFAKTKFNFEDLSNEWNSRRSACIFLHISTGFSFGSLAPAPIFCVVFSLLFSWARHVRHSVPTSWRSHIVSPSRHRTVLRYDLVSDSVGDRTTLLVITSQITAIIARWVEGLNVRNGATAANHQIAKSPPNPSNTHTSKPSFAPSPQLGRFGPSGTEKCRGQGAATKTVRMYGEEPQRSHRHFLRPASPARRSKPFQALFGSRGKRIV